VGTKTSRHHLGGTPERGYCVRCTRKNNRDNRGARNGQDNHYQCFADDIPAQQGPSIVGRTNGKGHEISAYIGLAKNVTIGIDYYDTEAIETPVPGELYKQKILQADLVMRW